MEGELGVEKGGREKKVPFGAAEHDTLVEAGDAQLGYEDVEVAGVGL